MSLKVFVLELYWVVSRTRLIEGVYTSTEKAEEAAGKYSQTGASPIDVHIRGPLGLELEEDCINGIN